MASINESGSFLDTNQSVEPTTKRSRKSTPKNPKYINRIDGKGCYLRFSMSCASSEAASAFISSLYEDRLIDDSYCHLFFKTRDGQSKYVLHAVVHVVSRDYDFNFWRKKIPSAHFKLSIYPDDTYKYNTNKEVVQAGQILPNTNMSMSGGMGQCQMVQGLPQPLNNQVWV